MRLSTRGRYAIRAASNLAVRSNDGPVALKTIAREEHIPLRYLEQLMNRMRHSGILESSRGPGGGYRLKRSPSDITLGEIVSAIEGRVAVAGCVKPDRQKNCRLEDRCASRLFWLKLSGMIQILMDNVTLQELNNGKWRNKDVAALIGNWMKQ
ncbi:MAG TPA: Rrf2 family transcriptional regulator [bacterium]